MRRITLCILACIAIITVASTSPAEKVSDLRPTSDIPGHRVRSFPAAPHLAPGRALAPAAIDTTVLIEWTFDDGLGGPDTQGWTTYDATAQIDTFFHVDDFAGLDGGDFGRLHAIQGTKSMWCGARPNMSVPYMCSWKNAPGYGDRWNQALTTDAIALGGSVTLSYHLVHDSEPDYDYTTVEYQNVSGNWEAIATYSGIGNVVASNVIPLTQIRTKLRFHFSSDPSIDDQDGLLNTDGACIVDSIRVVGANGYADFQDFEGAAVGSRGCGIWHAIVSPAYGNYAALVDGSAVLQEDTLVTNSTYFWSFFNGSTVDYGCAGHPEQAAVPYGKSLSLGGLPSLWQVGIDNSVVSPAISVPFGFNPDAAILLQFDVYRDLALNALVLYGFRVRSNSGGCWGPWLDDGFVRYGNSKDWFRATFDIGKLIDPGATEFQVSIGAMDYCDQWHLVYGDCSCHSHAPLVDNVRLLKLQDEVVVTNTNASGPGSLHQAILDANAEPNTSLIIFSIDGTGPHTIQPLTPLPIITAPVIIDGYTQPGASANTNGDGLGGNAVLKIELDGSAISHSSIENGLTIFADHSIVRGLAISNFFGYGVELSCGGSVVEGNYIGTDVTGTSAKPNLRGVSVSGDSNIVGGTEPPARNVISGNTRQGIVCWDFALRTLIQGNFIGLSASGTSGVPNGDAGVHLFTAMGTMIDKNIISANALAGVLMEELFSEDSEGNSIRRNLIGTDVTGIVPLGNGRDGVAMEIDNWIGPDITIGGAPGYANLIANNGGDGVRISLPTSGTMRATVSHNIIRSNENGVVVTQGYATISNSSIYSNSGLGIDLGDNGVTANDASDSDTGPNALQNFPVITAFQPESMTVTGTLNSTASTEFDLEFFSSVSCDASGCGEGATYRGGGRATTDAEGNAVFEMELSVPVPGGCYITATARPVTGGGTSEFSPCFEVINTPAGTNVAVTPVDETTGEAPTVITFDEVISAGNTLLEINGTGPAVPGTFVVGDSPMFYHLSTTATFNDSILVCFSYDEAEIPGLEKDLVILHYDTTLVSPDWVDITVSVDTVANVACGRTASLSPFVLAIPVSTTGADPTPEAPIKFALHQNIPNPFNPSTTIRFDLPVRAHVKLAIYNVKGQLVRVLLEGEIAAGRREVMWDGKDATGRGVASGIYFYNLQTPTFSESKKMIMLR